jgi:hypothetical protein
MGTVAENHFANQVAPGDDRLLVGVAELAAEPKVPQRQMYHWLSTGQIKSARKMGNQWVAGRRQFRRELGLD